MKFHHRSAEEVAEAIQSAREFPVRVLGLPVTHAAHIFGPYLVDKQVKIERALPVESYSLLADLLECEFLDVKAATDSDAQPVTPAGTVTGDSAGRSAADIGGALMAAAASNSAATLTVFLRNTSGVQFAIQGDRQLVEYLLPIANRSYERKFTIDDGNEFCQQRHRRQVASVSKVYWGCGTVIVLGLAILIILAANGAFQ